MGHSYGGATIIELMANLKKGKKVPQVIKGIICMDPWYFPLSESTYDNL